MKTLKRIGIALFILVFYFGGIFGSISLMGDYHDRRFGENLVFTATGKMTVIPFVLFILLTIIVAGIYDSYKEKIEEGREKKIVIIAKKALAVLVASILVMVCIAFSTKWMNYFTLDGVISCSPGKVKEYSWEEAECFELASDREGVLMFVIHMKDGKKYSFNGGWLRVVQYDSTAYTEKYGEGVYDYMPWLAVRLKEVGIPMNVKKWDKLMRKLEYESWRDCAEDIRSAYEGA